MSLWCDLRTEPMCHLTYLLRKIRLPFAVAEMCLLDYHLLAVVLPADLTPTCRLKVFVFFMILHLVYIVNLLLVQITLLQGKAFTSAK